MSDDGYVQVRVPELPDWVLKRPIGFHAEKPQMIVVERPPFKRRVEEVK